MLYVVMKEIATSVANQVKDSPESDNTALLFKIANDNIK